jgi:hypothetical protein
MQFYSVKERRMVEVPREHVRAHKYEHITKSGKRQVRYALQADYNGQRLTKFVDEATYLEYLSDDEDERRWDELFSRSQDLLAQMAKKALQDYHSGGRHRFLRTMNEVKGDIGLLASPSFGSG